MKETQLRIDAPRVTRPLSADNTATQVPKPVVVTRKEGKWRSRLTRWTIGGILLAFSGWLAATTFLYRTSVRATVTAPLVAVRIPMQGLIYGTPPQVGTTVTAGEKLFEVQAAEPDRRPSEGLRSESEAISWSVAALRAQMIEMNKLKGTLNTHFEQYRDARIEQTEKLVAEQEARVKETASRLKTAEFEQRLHKRLSSARRKTCSNLRDFVSRIGDLTVFRSDPSMASQAETQSRPLMTDPTKRKTYPPRTAGATRWFNHCSESLPATQAADRPRRDRPASLLGASRSINSLPST